MGTTHCVIKCKRQSAFKESYYLRVLIVQNWVSQLHYSLSMLLWYVNNTFWCMHFVYCVVVHTVVSVCVWDLKWTISFYPQHISSPNLMSMFLSSLFIGVYALLLNPSCKTHPYTFVSKWAYTSMCHPYTFASRTLLGNQTLSICVDNLGTCFL